MRPTSQDTRMLRSRLGCSAMIWSLTSTMEIVIVSTFYIEIYEIKLISNHSSLLSFLDLKSKTNLIYLLSSVGTS